MRTTTLAILVVSLVPQLAVAEGRYALLVGANIGAAGEVPLQFAHRDAEQMERVLTSLGSFLPENVVRLTEPSADRVRSALAKLNARIRTEAQPGIDSLLVVYYSGHADALALHLGESTLPWDELRNLTQSSAARARVLMVDACRSGHATRVKGATLVEPFGLPQDAKLPEGFAILSSATEGEAAQESDQIAGSFFTHHLIAGLRGIADIDGDGTVSLAEAYDYAFERTVASSAATLSGVQHPTYLYDLKGRSELRLTHLKGGQSGTLRFDTRGLYMLRDRGPEGPLVLEATVADQARTARLPPGRYFVQHRAKDKLHEGSFELAASQQVSIDQVPKSTIEYAALVRKGDGPTSLFSASLLGGAATPLLDGLSIHGTLGVQAVLHTRILSVDLGFTWLRADQNNEVLRSTLDGFSLAAGLRRSFDLGPLSVYPALRLGATLFHQHYDSETRLVPSRTRVVPHLDLLVGGQMSVYDSVYVGLEVGARGSQLRTRDGLQESIETPIQAVASAGVGIFF